MHLQFFFQLIYTKDPAYMQTCGALNEGAKLTNGLIITAQRKLAHNSKIYKFYTNYFISNFCLLAYSPSSVFINIAVTTAWLILSPFM